MDMPGYWIFVVKDHTFEGRIIPAIEVLANRVRNKFWSLNSKAPNVKNLSENDRVLFYVTSTAGKGFMGRGVLAGPAHPITVEQRFHVIGIPSIHFDYAVEFKEAEMWTRMVKLEDVREKLAMLRGKRNPAMIFRGSIKKISEEDYQKILDIAGK